MYTYKVEQAIQAASILHESHARKGTVPIPYITHLVGVTLIIRDYTTDEDVLVAAMLHDTLEDTEYTTEELHKDFGETVSAIVQTLSVINTDSLSWFEQKQQLARQLKTGPQASVLIMAADCAHNFRSIIEDYTNDHNAFLSDFGTNVEDRIMGYELIANVINSRLKSGIVHEFNHTFELYKQFLFDVQESK